MRDPELVFKAQLAASALERAWQRWRVVHGLVADPMPAISSYVGYSLEEPWGQPRVVFGLSADDAEQLTALLDRHDCIGPVSYAAAIHMAFSQPNTLIQESVRAFYTGYYRELVTVVPEVVNGFIRPIEGPGLGTELLPGVFDRRDVHRLRVAL